MKFELTKEQLEKLAEWKKTLKKRPKTAIGGAFTYKFTQTSIGLIAVVEYFDGSKIDLTDYDNF